MNVKSCVPSTAKIALGTHQMNVLYAWTMQFGEIIASVYVNLIGLVAHVKYTLDHAILNVIRLQDAMAPQRRIVSSVFQMRFCRKMVNENARLVGVVVIVQNTS